MANCLINGTNNNSGNAVAIKVLNFLIGKGLTPTMACAIVGNLFGESSYVPTKVNEIGCVGLVQWCYARKTAITTAYPNGGWKNVDNQLELMWGEYDNNHNNVKTYFSNTNRSLSEYCYYWLRWFETPSTNENELRTKFLPKRFTEAKRLAKLYNQMNKGECKVETSGGDVNSGFECDPSEEIETDVDLSDDMAQSSGSYDSSGGTSVSEEKSSTAIFIGDKIGNNIWTCSKALQANTKNGSSVEQPMTQAEIVSRVKYWMSNPNNIPSALIFYIGSGLVMTGKKTKTAVQQYVTGILNVIAKVNCKLYFIETVSARPLKTNSFQYIVNETIKNWVANNDIDGSIVFQSFTKNDIYKIHNEPGYTRYSNNNFWLTNVGYKYVGDRINSYIFG